MDSHDFFDATTSPPPLPRPPVPPVIERTYARPMERALELARLAGQVGEIPVGAVVLDPAGEIIGEGANTRQASCDPTAHAEIQALRAAGESLGTSHLDGCTLVVNLEPCVMCAGAIVLARIATVVFAAWEPKTGAAGSLRDVLRDPRANHQCQVIAGVGEAESQKLLRSFFAKRRPD